MRHLAIVPLALALVSCASSDGARPAPAAKTVDMPEVLRTYLVEKYFIGMDPHDPAIDAAVEPLRAAPALLEHVAALPWEKSQLERFGDSKRFFALVRTPGAKPHTIHVRGEHIRSDRELDEARVRILRRLYLGKGFLAPEAKELAAWAGKDVDAAAALERAAKLASPAWGEDVVARANKNIGAPGTRAAELGRALQALADTEGAPELCRAAVWLVSRMDGMTFYRFKPDESGMDPETSVNDLKSVDARLFYENVFYAVKAKNELPWGRELTDHDFLQFVLSPRGTGEPLQRWRRLFYEALMPEVRWLPRKDLDKAIKLATDATYDFFQYEGDTTWEDFGPVSALAVHEGRCEDCSNMENVFQRTIAIPGCQAFTPFWATGDGNHAWTWIPAFGVECGEARSAAKVFVKTWDELEDVTDKYVPVTRLEFESKDGEAQLMVWNMDEWRRVAKVQAKDGKAVFEKVGCPVDMVLGVKLPGAGVKAIALAKGGAMTPFDESAPGKGDFAAVAEEKAPANPAWANTYAGVETWTADGWKEIPSEARGDYSRAFQAEGDRLYRLKRAKGFGRPFVVVRDGDGKTSTSAR